MFGGNNLAPGFPPGANQPLNLNLQAPVQAAAANANVGPPMKKAKRTGMELQWDRKVEVAFKFGLEVSFFHTSYCKLYECTHR